MAPASHRNRLGMMVVGGAVVVVVVVVTVVDAAVVDVLTVVVTGVVATVDGATPHTRPIVPLPRATRLNSEQSVWQSLSYNTHELVQM